MLCDIPIARPEPELYVDWNQSGETAQAKAQQKPAPPLQPLREKHAGARDTVEAALRMIGPASVRALVAHTGLTTEVVATAMASLRLDIAQRERGDGTKGNPYVWRIREGA